MDPQKIAGLHNVYRKDFSYKHTCTKNVHNIKTIRFMSLTGNFTNVSLGYPNANSLPMKNPGKLGVSGRVFQGA